MIDVTVIVLAKEPVAGRAKTRLSPPLAPRQAAELAEAALADTLAAVAATPAARRLLVLDGSPGPWLPNGVDVVPQVAGDLGRRLGAAFDAAGGPGLLVGMDTPQLTPSLLRGAASTLMRDGVEAVLGPASDGGYWTIGLRRPRPEVFTGVPMSTPETAMAQRHRLRELGIRWRELAPLCDVDTIADARTVAARWPRTRFAGAVRTLPAWSSVAA